MALSDLAARLRNARTYFADPAVEAEPFIEFELSEAMAKAKAEWQDADPTSQQEVIRYARTFGAPGAVQLL